MITKQSYKQAVLSFWLEKPMQVYTPILQALARHDPQSPEVFFFPAKNEGLFGGDAETGAAAIWGKEMLQGYNYVVQRPGYWAALRVALTIRFSSQPRLVILQGTNKGFCRAALVGLLGGKHRVLIRYDATRLYSTSGRQKQWVKKFVMPILFRCVDHLAYTGEWTKEYLLHYGAKSAQLFHFPYVIDDIAFAGAFQQFRTNQASLRKSFHIDPQAIVFLAVAKFNNREAPVDLVAAFNRVDSPAVHLLLVGDGPQRESIEAAVVPEKRSRVTFTGYMQYETLPSAYACADVFVHGAADEVWGVSVNEALCCGLPVVAADTVGAAVELVTDGVNGFLYKLHDVAKLAGIIGKMADEIELWRARSNVCRTSAEKVAPEIVAVELRQLLDRMFSASRAGMFCGKE